MLIWSLRQIAPTLQHIKEQINKATRQRKERETEKSDRETRERPRASPKVIETVEAGSN